MPIGFEELMSMLGKMQQFGLQSGMEGSTVGSNQMQASKSLETLVNTMLKIASLPQNQPGPEEIAAQPNPFDLMRQLELRQRMQQSGMLGGFPPPGALQQQRLY